MRRCPGGRPARSLRTMDRTADRLRSGLLVVDADRRVFDALSSLDLRVPLWCVTDASRVRRLDDMALAVHAAYGHVDWDLLLALTARTRTMVIAETGDPADGLRALSCGAIGYVDLAAARDGLRSIVQGAMRGEAAYAPEILGKWLDMQSGRAADGGSHALTPRQRQVLGLVARGDTDKAIASALRISTATAQKHVTNILERLGVPNRAAAVATVFSPAASWLARDRGDDAGTAALAS